MGSVAIESFHESQVEVK